MLRKGLSDLCNEAPTGLREFFVRFMTHDIRSPLTNIKGYNDLLLEGMMGGELKDEQKRALKVVRKNCMVLLETIDRVVDLYRLQCGELELKPRWVDFCEIVAESVDAYRERAQDKGIELPDASLPEGLPEVRCDRTRMRLVCDNLISNAVKFCSSGDRIEVSLGCEEGICRLSVKDSGPGIAEDEVETLFKPFSVVSTQSTAGEKGYGVGLTLVKELVLMHGGNVEVKTVLGEGSEFIITIPHVGPGSKG